MDLIAPLAARLAILAERPWFSYTTILLLQAKVLWGMWLLTPGDTSRYFVSAYGWYRHRTTNIAWSPLYTSFYGSFLHLSQDAYVATIGHRLVILLVIAVLVLALMRRLLPPALAWLAAAWWAIMPVDYAAVAEVHLFAAIPVLIAWLVLVGTPSPWRRGAALGVFASATLLVRNEMLVVTVLFALACLVSELRTARRAPRTLREIGLAYGLPLALAVLLTGFLYTASRVRFPELWPHLRGKHTVNVCQIYAFGYRQRHPEWTLSPWTECDALMRATFGAAGLSFLEAWRGNPVAMSEHLIWNASLIPNGLQVLLFNAMSGQVSPDYSRVVRGWWVAMASVVVVAVCAAGFVRLYTRRREWTPWFESGRWCLLAMACVAAMSTLVMVMQRPRPAYLFALGLALRAAAAIGAWALVRGWPRLPRLEPLFPAVVVALLVAAPTYGQLEEHALRLGATAYRGQRLMRHYGRLAPFAHLTRAPGCVILVPELGEEITNYVRTDTPGGCEPLDVSLLPESAKSVHSGLPQVVSRATLLYADETLIDDPVFRDFLANPSAHRWEIVTVKADAGGSWMLLARRGSD